MFYCEGEGGQSLKKELLLSHHLVSLGYRVDLVEEGAAKFLCG